MGTAGYNRIFVLGNHSEGNREVVYVQAGVDTDLPASAEFYYTDLVTQFPYTLGFH